MTKSLNRKQIADTVSHALASIGNNNKVKGRENKREKGISGSGRKKEWIVQIGRLNDTGMILSLRFLYRNYTEYIYIYMYQLSVKDGASFDT